MATLTKFVDHPDQHVAAISPLLKHDHPDVRAMAVFLLGRAGTAAEKYVPEIITLLEAERHGPTQIRAAEALLRLSPGNASAEKTLLAGLRSTEAAIRWEAVCVAGVFSRRAEREEVITLLIGLVQDDDQDTHVRIMAALKLGDFKQDKPRVVPPLKHVTGRSALPKELLRAARVSLAVLSSRGSAPRPLFAPGNLPRGSVRPSINQPAPQHSR